MEFFDLTLNNNTILNGANPDDFDITYYGSQNNANDAMGVPPSLYTNGQ
jgi:hypothetical protein